MDVLPSNEVFWNYGCFTIKFQDLCLFVFFSLHSSLFFRVAIISQTSLRALAQMFRSLGVFWLCLRTPVDVSAECWVGYGAVHWEIQPLLTEWLRAQTLAPTCCGLRCQPVLHPAVIVDHLPASSSIKWGFLQ